MEKPRLTYTQLIMAYDKLHALQRVLIVMSETSHGDTKAQLDVAREHTRHVESILHQLSNEKE